MGQNALKVDPTYTIDHSKMDPVDWLQTIIRCKDLSVRGLRFANHTLQYSKDDPEKPESGKTWYSLLNTSGVTNVRERYDVGTNAYFFEYSTDGGVNWQGVDANMKHNNLLGRKDEDCHPIDSITGLRDALNKKVDPSDVYDKSETYSKEEVDTALGKKANASTTYSKTEVDNALAKKLNIQQGASNVGKILKIGEDGNIIASSEAGGLASVNHDDTLEGAGTDSSPLVVAGKEKLTNKVTNCILKIPQNIKLTLNGNQITLASGSTYYVPNGVGKFNAVTTSADITYTPRSNGTRLLLMNSAGTNMDAPNITNCYSQESQPSGNSIYWWDLSNNLVKSIVSGSVGVSGVSLPIALLTVDGNNVTIEKVFNGVGFMGTTIYTTPDLLVAVPNGRNSDGTLKNAISMQTRVNVYTLESFTRTELYAASTQLLAVGENTYTYDFVQNKILTGPGDQRTFIKIGTVSNNGSTITGIDLDEPFAAVDYNEYVKDLSNINESINQLEADKQDNLTASQLNAVNSGITATKVATYDGYAGQIAGKQNTLAAGSNIRISGNTISATGLAKIDLSNVSAGGIDTAVGWGIPDYSAGVVNSTVLPSFTCDQDYLFIFVAYRSATEAGTMTINVDNNQVAIITSNDFGWVYLPIYVRKGSVVTTSYSNLTTASSTRFPLLKGA